MSTFRRQLTNHRLLAIWLIAAALIMRVIIPAGFMPITSAGKITIALCSGYGPQTVTMAMPGTPHGTDDKGGGQGKAEQPCAFSGLSATSLAALDSTMLALAIAFIVATVFRAPTAIPVESPSYLRPPLRGPPASG